MEHPNESLGLTLQGESSAKPGSQGNEASRMVPVNLGSIQEHPLILAAKIGNLALLRQILDSKRADVNYCNEEGETALHWVASIDNIECAEYLVAKG